MYKWYDVKDEGGHLLFRYDPIRQLVSIKTKRGQMLLIDLAQYGAEQAS